MNNNDKQYSKLLLLALLASISGVSFSMDKKSKKRVAGSDLSSEKKRIRTGGEDNSLLQDLQAVRRKQAEKFKKEKEAKEKQEKILREKKLKEEAIADTSKFGDGSYFAFQQRTSMLNVYFDLQFFLKKLETKKLNNFNQILKDLNKIKIPVKEEFNNYPVQKHLDIIRGVVLKIVDKLSNFNQIANVLSSVPKEIESKINDIGKVIGEKVELHFEMDTSRDLAIAVKEQLEENKKKEKRIKDDAALARQLNRQLNGNRGRDSRPQNSEVDADLALAIQMSLQEQEKNNTTTPANNSNQGGSWWSKLNPFKKK